MLAARTLLLLAACSALADARSFTIENDRFVADGTPVQLIAGCVHYFRIPRPYWRDRLLKLKAMGLNSIEMYIAWNFHERQPEQYTFDGDADVEAFIREAASLDLKVLLRPGPYICAEWDFGGFPWWFASSAITEGGRSFDLRSDDPHYLQYVDRWWSVLFKRIKPLLWENGGPIVMVQVENEYGACSGTWGPDRAHKYLRHLIATARRELGPNALLYTTDPPNQIEQGTLRGDEVFSAVDFGPGWWQLDQAFGIQASYNPPGKSAPICTEFYTGWLTHWTEKMANNSASQLVDWFSRILTYKGNSGSLSLYMAHGGTNFGFWAGANVGDTYQPHITSYDYDCPVSEAGGYGQPGIGGDNKFELLRQTVQKLYPSQPLPDVPPPSKTAGYGPVALKQGGCILHMAQGGLQVDVPENMEQYNQSGGLILYRTSVPVSEFQGQAVLRLAVHDYAKVYVAGRLAGTISRNEGQKDSKAGPLAQPLQSVELQVPADVAEEGPQVPLEVLVEAMGRSNFGCEWDLKGIVNPSVTLNDKVLRKWTVHTMPLDDVKALQTQQQRSASLDEGPVFLSGTFNVPQGAAASGNAGFPADTFLHTPGFGKGVAWVNGFNLGWYWPSAGPQMRLYVPGTVLQEGSNDLVLLEMDSVPSDLQVQLVDAPDFRGPGGADMA